MYNHLLIPTDGSPLSDEAIRHGVALAAETGAKVTFLTVIEPFHTFSFGVDQLQETADTYQTNMQERATRILAEAARVATTAGVAHEVIQTEDDQPYQAIIRTVEERGCDLIAMASHGRRGVSALVLGSETVKVLTHSIIPVLVYRSPSSRPDLARHEVQAERAAERQMT
ncbi:universal stress protein [Microvirga massiliensis]|uniref:universal stress protein n=1 Tax=Microvirga massiliensis TaxID=1033741 RepID=UPI0007C69C43